MVAACGDCIQAAKDPPKTAILPWPMTRKPWTRLHVDYAGPVEGWMLLIVQVRSNLSWHNIQAARYKVYEYRPQTDTSDVKIRWSIGALNFATI